MKKKLLSLILVIMMIPSIFIFSACRDNSYKLSSFNNDFKKMVESYDNLLLTAQGHIEFNYSSYEKGGNRYFTNAIADSSAPYKYLTTFYNPILDDALTFVYEYKEVCSRDSINASKTIRNELKNNLDNFNNALKSTSKEMDEVADMINFNSTDIAGNLCMTKLRILFDTYDNLWQAAFNLNDTLSRIYFNYALNDANHNYSNTRLADFDSNKPLSLLTSRIAWQKANLTHTYVSKYITGGTVSNNFTTKTGGSFGSQPSSYNSHKANVNKIDRCESVINGVSLGSGQTLASKINGSAQKSNFYYACIALYNYQTTINNDVKLYKLATSSIAYTTVKAKANPSNYETDCANIIDNFYNLIISYNDALDEIITIIGSV